jgi:hypothetical protein
LNRKRDRDKRENDRKLKRQEDSWKKMNEIENELNVENKVVETVKRETKIKRRKRRVY